MKNLFNITAIAYFALSALMFLSSCNNNQDGDNSIENIGYINSKTGEYEKINEKQLRCFYINTLEVNDDVYFSNRIVEIKDSTENYYIINSISKDGSISIGAKLSVYEKSKGLFAMTGETCKCESNDCLWSGCEVTRMCACSACSGDCKKTHTLKSELVPSMFVKQ
ncbi:MAG: hypothetical protein R6V32_07115 [Bacteroidales bacterium]